MSTFFAKKEEQKPRPENKPPKNEPKNNDKPPHR